MLLVLQTPTTHNLRFPKPPAARPQSQVVAKLSQRVVDLGVGPLLRTAQKV